MLIVPPLYSASDEVLKRIAAFVENGGHAIVAFKTGFTNEYSTVRWERAPGPLRQAAGFSYQEFSNLAEPVALKPDRYGAGAKNQASVWAEFLLPEGAETLLTYDHPFFGRWPALTRHHFGRGTFTYEGTVLTHEVQTGVLREVLKLAGLESEDWSLPKPVQVRHGVNARGRAVHYYLNYSGRAAGVHLPLRGRQGTAQGNTRGHRREDRARAVGCGDYRREHLGAIAAGGCARTEQHRNQAQNGSQAKVAEPSGALARVAAARVRSTRLPKLFWPQASASSGWPSSDDVPSGQ